MPHLYFAYGSNLDWGQMQARCPSSEFVCVAELKHHKLGFTRFSPSANRRCGVADVLPDRQSGVWGVVYTISRADLIALDRIEGYDPEQDVLPGAYGRKRITVHASAGPQTAVEIYQVHNPTENHPTSAAYKAHLVRGAHHWKLPAAYIAFLEAIPVE